MKNILFSLLLFLVISVVAIGWTITNASTDDPNEAQQTASSPQWPCSDDLFIKIGEHTFRVLRSSIDYVDVPEGDETPRPCQASPETAVQADYFSFQTRLAIPGFNKKLRIQYKIDSQPPYRDTLSYIQKNLKDTNRTLSDLPKEGPFYKYKNDIGSEFHIAEHPALVTPNGEPLILVGGSSRDGFFAHDMGFEWGPGVNVVIRTMEYPTGSMPQPESMDAWIEAFPIILKHLENTEYTD